MSNHYIKYKIAVASQEQNDILVALLGEWQMEGFEETDGFLIASGKPQEIDGDSIDNYLSENMIGFSKTIVEEQNWNTVWESNFEPVKVDDFVGIRANFHPHFTNVTHEITITPKMSFGTGHHATTYNMMKLMQGIVFADTTVFDFGTGTGILAILAEKLGAAHIFANDNDDWCILNSAENIEQNNCVHIDLQKANQPPNGQFDIVLANINKNIILQYFDELVSITAPNGYLLISGLLKTDERDIMIKTYEYPVTVFEKLEKNGWLAFKMGKNRQ